MAKKISHKGWVCTNCTFKNKWTQKKCIICATAKNYEDPYMFDEEYYALDSTPVAQKHVYWARNISMMMIDDDLRDIIIKESKKLNWLPQDYTYINMKKK